MYKSMMKHQHTFFSNADDVLSFFKGFKVGRNDAGLYYLKINGEFKASFYENQKEDAILFYGNQMVHRNLNKGKA